METDKTLLQQIREKEQEFAARIEATKKETEAAITAAESDAESLLCTADSAGKKEAEQIYWEEKGKLELEIAALKKAAETDREIAVRKGEANLPEAVGAIIRTVIME